MSSSSPAKQLRALLSQPGILHTVAIHDVFSALIAEKCGVPLLFIGGFGTTASLYGLPDLNYLSATDMADAIRRTSGAVDIPIIVDGDTGHGDLHNVQFTVDAFERAGAAGIILEDQLSPKRCGHFADKSVIPKEEMILKIKAAVAAKADQDFAIVARTDARQVSGIGDALERMESYCAAGADIAFVEAPETSEELAIVAQSLAYPTMANMLTGGKTPIHPVGELGRMGFKIAVLPIESLMVCATALETLFKQWLEEGDVQKLMAHQAASFDDLKSLLRLEERLGVKDRLPKD